MLSTCRFAAVAALVSAVTGTQAQSLIVNGGFETPVVPVASYQLFATGSPLGKWTVVGQAGDVAVINSQFTGGGFTYNPKAGEQVLDLTGTTRTFTGVQQRVITTPGQSYVLTFWTSNLYNNGGSSTVEVLVNGVTAMRATNFSNAGLGQAWKLFRLQFTAPSDQTVVTFMNADPSNDDANGLDEVTMVPATN